jgi:hypothetical protein
MIAMVSDVSRFMAFVAASLAMAACSAVPPAETHAKTNPGVSLVRLR